MEKEEYIPHLDNAPADEIIKRPICPLTYLTNEQRCVRCAHNCAWYDHYEQKCAILVISSRASKLSGFMEKISKAMR